MRAASYSLLLSLLGAPALAFAQQAKFADPATAAQLPVSGVSSVGYVTVALAIVLGMVYGAAWLLRRLKTFNRGGQQNLDVLEAVSLGPKERAVLVRVKDRQILLGVSPGRVTMLVDLGQQAIESPQGPQAGPSAANNSTEPPTFKSLLKRSMGLS
jgi:flagellar protein FliO/FliZ